MEKYLNFIIGLCVLGNLYYLSPLIGISSDYFIVFLFVISFIFFLKYNIKSKSPVLLIYILTFSFLALSIIFSILHSINNSYEFRINNILRILWYAFFFAWTYSYYKGKNILSLFSKWSVVILSIIIIVSIFEVLLPSTFNQLLFNSETEIINTYRISGTYRDPNSLSAALITYTFIYIYINGINLKSLLYFLIAGILINISGSRMGGILLILLVFYLFKYFNLRRLIKTLFFGVIFGAIAFFMINNIFSTGINFEFTSVIDRFFNDENKISSNASNLERLESLKNGIEFGWNNLFLPTGDFLYESKWAQEQIFHYPHNSFIFLFAEYGIYFLWPLYIYFLLWKKSKVSKLNILYILSILMLFFLPNFMYYATFFFIFFFIEIIYENRCYSPLFNK